MVSIVTGLGCRQRAKNLANRDLSTFRVPVLLSILSVRESAADPDLLDVLMARPKGRQGNAADFRTLLLRRSLRACLFPDGFRKPFGIPRDHSAARLSLYPSQISADLLQIIVETASVFVSYLPHFLKYGIVCFHSQSPEAHRAYI